MNLDMSLGVAERHLDHQAALPDSGICDLVVRRRACRLVTQGPSKVVQDGRLCRYHAHRSVVYCGFRATSTRPRNLLWETMTREIQTFGRAGSTWQPRLLRARHACRRASAVGDDHFTHVECFPSVEKSAFRASDVWKSASRFEPNAHRRLRGCASPAFFCLSSLVIDPSR